MEFSFTLLEKIVCVCVFLATIGFTKTDCALDKIELREHEGVFFTVSVPSDPSIPPLTFKSYEIVEMGSLRIIKILYPLDATYTCIVSTFYNPIPGMVYKFDGFKYQWDPYMARREKETGFVFK